MRQEHQKRALPDVRGADLRRMPAGAGLRMRPRERHGETLSRRRRGFVSRVLCERCCKPVLSTPRVDFETMAHWAYFGALRALGLHAELGVVSLLAKRTPDAIVLSRALETLRELHARGEIGSVATLIRSLEPAHPKTVPSP